MKRILVVAMNFPYPPNHGSAIDVWTRILVLTDMGYSVDLLSTVRDKPSEECLKAVRERVGNVWVVQRQCGLSAALSVLPFQVRSRAHLRNVILDHTYDAIILESDWVTAFLENPTACKGKRILRIHNEQVGFFRELGNNSETWSKKLFYYSESLKFFFFSRQAMRKCDYLWFISESDRQSHLRKVPDDRQRSHFLPTHVSSSALRPHSVSSRTALFIGGLTITNNIESVIWFIENVHPLLRELHDYRFQVAGRTAGQPIPSLKRLIQKSPNDICLVEDPVELNDLYEGAAVFVNPVISGAGFKVKVINAIQAGLPVVSTSLGVEGTGFKDSIHVLVADTPQEFADCVRRLLTEPPLAKTLVDNAQRFLAENYDMNANMQRHLTDILSGCN